MDFFNGFYCPCPSEEDDSTDDGWHSCTNYCADILWKSRIHDVFKTRTIYAPSISNMVNCLAGDVIIKKTNGRCTPFLCIIFL